MFTKKSKTAFLFFSFVFSYSFGQLKVLNNGNVGIGDSNPANTLTIYPIGQIPQRTSIWRFGIQTKFFLPSYSNVEDNGKFEVFGSYTNNTQFNADNPSLLTRLLHIKANTKLVQIGADDALTILNNGNVGIGQSNPTIKLEVLGSGGTDVNLRVNGRMSSNNTNGGLWCGENNTFMGGHENNKIGFWNQGWRMSVLNNGNIGIGTTTPNYRLSFGNLANFKSLALFESGSEFYGLGISNLSFDFWIGNPSASFAFRNPSGAVVAAITSIGDIFQNNSYAKNYYYNTSDRRLKNNIVSIDKALDKIAALRGIHYELKDSVDAAFFENTVANADTSKNSKKAPNLSKKTGYGASAPSKTTFGFVAQEIETVLPELVSTSASSIKSVNYIGVIPILVEAMREQQTQIESLKAEVKKLKNTKAGARTDDTKSSTEKTTSIAYLYQNTPNPFSQETTIKYSLPETVQDAFISITDLSGKQLKTLPIATKGESSVVLKANELYAGLFVYTLIADGNIVDSKRMVIVE